jgi:hypothetical protein
MQSEASEVTARYAVISIEFSGATSLAFSNGNSLNGNVNV